MSDYSTLAHRIAISVPGIRGCLMLSRDGSVLGAHPEGEAESYVKSAWVRFSALGEAERSFVEFPDQTWAFVRRGGYAAFAVADLGVRPGILVDLLEQALMAGEQERAHDRDTMRLPETPSAPSGKPRTSLHKPERSPAPEPADVAGRVAADDPEPGSEPGSEGAEATSSIAEPGTASPGTAAPERKRRFGRKQAEPDDESEVDRILLAKEFAGLLQVPKEDDEASR